MSQNQDFLNNFQKSIDRLANINSIIEKNTQGKQEFSEVVFRRLREINEKVRSLGNKIQELKSQLTTLEQQVTENNTNIQSRDANIQQLQAQIASLTAERDQLKQQMDELNQRTQAETQNLQQRIDQGEAQIRQLTEQNANLTQQIQELNEAATLRGNEAAAQSQAIQEHATKMEEQRQLHANELEQIKQQNNAQIDQLKQQIETNDKTMSDLQTNSSAEIQRLNQEFTALTQEKDAAQAQILELQRQIEELRSQNDNLIQRIITATDAINEAMNALEQINNPADLQKNLQQADSLFNEVEESLENISRAIHGREVISIDQRLENRLNSIPDKISNDANIVVDRQGTTITYQELKNGLIQKIKQNRRDPKNKYLLALQEIKKISDPKQVINILRKLNVDFNNGIVIGGKKYKKTRKMRKIRKQRGGFVYDTPSSRKKRRSLSTFTKTSKITVTPSSLLFKNKKSKRNSKTSKMSSKSSYASSSK